MSTPKELQRVNPYAVTHSIDEGAAAPTRPNDASTIRFRVSLGLAAILYVGSAVSAIFACIDIESIVGSGPLMSAAALAAIIAARKSKLARFRYQAVAAIGFSIACFLIIWLLGLSPQQAHRPIGSLVVAFALLMNTQWPGWYRERRRFRERQDGRS